MSSTVDERIVEMTFDNKQFEQGVSTTIKSIDELKKSLKFDDAAKGLDILQNSIRDVDFSNMSAALQAITDKFSVFGTFKDQILRDLVGYVENKVIGTFNRLKDAMTIGSQVWTGFSEYETKMNAIQVLKSSVIGTGDIGITITPEVDQAAKDIIYNGLYGTGAERKAVLEEMGLDYAAVQSRVEEIVANNWQWVESANGVAYTMDDINATLDTMNEYADKTIYNFPQMTENLGKFTTAGVDLKTAEKAIIGLSNLAASAGADATQMAQATYQMSQAMSSGMIRLMDWNSLAQRSMDTAQFKKVILAVAEKQGVATEILAKANENFRDSLSEEWLTSDIFNEALAVYSDRTTAASYGFEGVYDMAMEAAQRIRTFTMLKDTITEQIQSGWTESWEYIIGDSEEAAVALTRLNDVIANLLQPTMDARNSMLEFWHDFGGREAVVNGLFNILDAFTKALGTVKTAWREIFPKEGKGGKLVAYSKAFEAFTEKLIMGRDTADKVRRTFKGFFAILDLGLNVVTSLFRALSPVFDLFKKNKGEKGLLDYTASLGDFLVALHDGAIESDFFYNIFSKVVNFILSVPDKIGSAIHALEEYLGIDFSDIFHSAYETVKNFVVDVASTIADFKNIDTSGVGSFASSVKEKLGPLGKIGAFLSGFWEVLKAVAVKFAPVFKAIGSVVSDGLGKLKESILGGLENVDSDKIVDLIMSGSVVALIWKIIGVINDFKDSISGKNGFGAILANVNDILGGFQETLSAFTLSVKADALLKIAAAVAILAASMWALTKVDKAGLEMAIQALATAFIELLISLRSLSVAGPAVVVTATAMLIMVGAVIELAGAMAILSLMDPKKLFIGVAAISVLMTVLSKSMSKLGGLYQPAFSVAAAIIAFSNAIIKLVGAVAILSLFDMETIGTGIAAIAVMAFIMVKSIQGIGKANKDILSATPAIIVLSNAMITLAGAMFLFGTMDAGKLVKSTVALTAAMGILVGAIVILGKANADAKSMAGMSLALFVLSQSMITMVAAMAAMALIDTDNIAAPTVAIMGLIVELAIASKIVGDNYESIIALGAAVWIMSKSMLSIAAALALVSQFDSGSVVGAAIAISAIILSMGVSMALISRTGASGAKATLMVAAALFVMAMSVKELAKLDVKKELLPAAGVLVVFIGALTGLLAVVGAFGDKIAGTWKAFLAMAAALVGMGIAVTLLVKAFEKCDWKDLWKAGAALAFLLGIMTIGGFVAEKFGTGMFAFAGSLLTIAAAIAIFNAGMLALVTSFEKLANGDFTNLGENIKTVCNAIIESAPLIGEAVYEILTAVAAYGSQIAITLLESVADTLETAGDTIVRIGKAIINVIGILLALIEEASYGIASSLIGILAQIFYGMASRIDELTDSIVVLVIAIITGFADAIIEHRGEIADALILAVVAAFLALGTVFEKLGDLLGDALSAIWEFGKTIAVKIVRGFKNGVVALWTWFTDLPTNIGNILTSLWEDIKEIGGYLLDGLVEGLCNLGDKIKDFCNMVWQAIKDFFGISSPSKLMEEAGGYMVDGLANGLNDDGTAVDATENLCGDINDTFSSNMDDIFNADNYSFDLNSLVGENGEFITPVMDMDTITAQMSDFTSGQSMSINTSMNDQLSSQVASSMSDYTDYSEKVVNEISKLRTDVNAINTRLDGISVVLDTGALVGQLTTPINAQLGRLLAMSQRGLFK